MSAINTKHRTLTSKSIATKVTVTTYALVALFAVNLFSQAEEQAEGSSPYIIEVAYQTGDNVVRETISTEDMPFLTPTQCKSGLNNSVLQMHALSELARRRSSFVTLGCMETASKTEASNRLANNYLASIKLYLYQDQALIPTTQWMTQPPYVVLQEVIIGKEHEDAKIGIAMIKQEPFDGILYSSLTGSDLNCDTATNHDYIIQMKLQRLIYNEGATRLDLNCFNVDKKGRVTQLSSNSIDIAAERQKIFGDEDEYLDDEEWTDNEESHQ